MTYIIESDGNIYNDETGATVLLCADAKRLARRLIAERDRQAEYGRSYKYSYLRACDERDQTRRWAAAWKRAAKNKREWLHVAAKVAAEQIVEHAHCQEERDLWRERALEAGKKYNEARVVADQAIGDLRAVASLAIGAEEEQAIVDVVQHAAALLMKVKDGDHE